MQKRIVHWIFGFGLLVLLSAAGNASATSISLVWSATSGGGVGVGTNTISGVLPGETVTLEIRINATAAGVTFAGFNLTHTALLTPNAASAVECPSPPAVAPGFCSVAPAMTPLNVGVVPGAGAAGPNSFGLFEANTFAAGGVTVPYTLGRISFTAGAAGAGQVGTAYGPSGSINDGAFNMIADSQNPNGVPIVNASFSIVPEPDTVLLLALGLGLTGLARSRSRPVSGSRTKRRP